MKAVRCAVALVAVSLIVASACTRAEPGPHPPIGDATRHARPTVTVAASPTAPASGLPSWPRVENVALGRSHGLVAQAIEDLKRVGLWGRLTRDHYVIRIASRPGERGVPDDRHLADALATILRDERGEGKMCDIVFYPVAMAEDRQRWSDYYVQGSLSDPPPSERDFWASILAHELAHCVGLGRGESFAQRWEDRALEELRP